MAARAMRPVRMLSAGLLLLLCHVVTAAPALEVPDTHIEHDTTPLSVPIIHAAALEPRKLHGRFLHITGECVYLHSSLQRGPTA